MSVAVRLACVGLFTFGTSGCVGGGESLPECPARNVILDAGIDGLPDAGENVPRKTCIQLCGLNTCSCSRVKEDLLICQPACK